jgi:hypothetical protein
MKTSIYKHSKTLVIRKFKLDNRGNVIIKALVRIIENSALVGFHCLQYWEKSK